MTREKIEIGRAILNYLLIMSDACSQEKLINFLAAQRGYKRELIVYVLGKLIYYKLVGTYNLGIETQLYITLYGNQALNIGLSTYMNANEDKVTELIDK